MTPAHERAAVQDIRLQTVDTLPAVCADVLIEIHRSLVRSLRASLSEFLETDVNVAAPEADQVPYGQYLQTIEAPVFACVATSDFLTGPILATSDHVLASALIDRVFGGSGVPAVDRWPTDVDVSVFGRLVDIVLGGMETAYRPLVATTFKAERIELSPHFVSVAAHHEPVITFRLEFKMGTDDIGALTICYPFSVLAPLIESLPGADVPPPPASPPTAIDVEETPMTLRLSLHHTRVAIGDFMSLRVGDVVILDHWADEPAVGAVGNQPVLGVQLGQQDGHLAAVVSDWRDK